MKQDRPGPRMLDHAYLTGWFLPDSASTAEARKKATAYIAKHTKKRSAK